MSDPGERILIVEDEGSLADSVRYNLEREGYVVTVAEDGRQALERFRAESPALVILDLMLPEVSGLDLCRTIRSESDVPIIMVTAKDSEADKVAGLELGADERDRLDRILAHLFQHDIHHRGQIHAMLAGTRVKPPQLDEFYCTNEAALRAADFAELGFTEARIWNP